MWLGKFKVQEMCSHLVHVVVISTINDSQAAPSLQTMDVQWSIRYVQT
jgi:hypothetical protein